MLTDPNTGVHVRAGDWIVAHRAVPRQDLFSFALAGRHWCDWEWLSDLVFALLHRWGGLPAIAAFSLALLCLISIIVYRTPPRRGGGCVFSDVLDHGCYDYPLARAPALVHVATGGRVLLGD